jgi:hypothetical protein
MMPSTSLLRDVLTRNETDPMDAPEPGPVPPPIDTDPEPAAPEEPID